MFPIKLVSDVGMPSAFRGLQSSFKHLCLMGRSAAPCMNSLCFSQPNMRTVVFTTRTEKVPSLFKLGMKDLDIRRKLKAGGITSPTDCQVKALPHLFAGHHTVIRAASGSGSTLCYLMFLVQRLARDLSEGSKAVSGLLAEKEQLERYQGVKHLKLLGPQALVLVPTAQLADQVAAVFNHYAAGGLQACAVHRGSPLQIKANVVVIVAVPHALQKSHLPSVLRRVHTVICDNANLLMVNGTFRLLSFLENNLVCGERRLQVQQKKSDGIQTNSEEGVNKADDDEELASVGLPTPADRQFVFVVSSKPDRYPKFVSWLHSFNDPAFVAGVCLKEEIELSPLLSHQFSDASSVEDKFEQLLHFLRGLIRVEDETIYLRPSDCPTVLIVARKSNVDLVGSVLTHQSLNNSRDRHKSSRRGGGMSSKEWWVACTGKLFRASGVADSSRSLQGFLTGRVKVLVCAPQLLSGLQLPRADAVIFYDLPRLPATYVQLAQYADPSHGKIFTLVEGNDTLLVQVLRRCLPLVHGVAEIKEQRLTKKMQQARRQTILNLLLGNIVPSEERLKHSLRLLEYMDSVEHKREQQSVPLIVEDDDNDDFIVLDNMRETSSELKE